MSRPTETRRRSRPDASQAVNEVADGDAGQGPEREDGFVNFHAINPLVGQEEQTAYQRDTCEFFRTYEAVFGTLGNRLPVLGIG
jgi:hypothetical protein